MDQYINGNGNVQVYNEHPRPLRFDELIECPTCDNPVSPKGHCPACGTPVAAVLRWQALTARKDQLTKFSIVSMLALLVTGSFAFIDYPVWISKPLIFAHVFAWIAFFALNTTINNVEQELKSLE